MRYAETYYEKLYWKNFRGRSYQYRGSHYKKKDGDDRLFFTMGILIRQTTVFVTIRLVMLGNQSSGWLPKCSCEGNVCTEVGTRFNV